jgi:peptidoglycan lytic transglycosylase G
VTIRINSLVALAVAVGVVVLGAFAIARLPNYAIAAPAAPSSLPPMPSTETVTVQVNQGDTADVIADRLQSAGVIRSAELFKELTALEGLQNGLAAGQYQLNRGLPVAEVITRLHNANTGAIRVTIPEGKRIDEVAQILEKANVVPAQAFLDALQNGHYSYDFLRDNSGGGLEGYVFPDTYNFPLKNDPEAVVNVMLKDFGQRVTPEMRSAYQQEGLSIRQAVTLASIVEREAQVPAERPTIASVFFNRMKLGMPLQADPTVQFALSRDPKSVGAFGLWKQALTLEDLTIDSPYNTYIHTGLPPTPIANPGLASLEAVAHPAQSDYLFFVAKDDGSHVFAATFAEHQANIAKYQH